MQEEVFGPVVCVVPFDNEEEVIITHFSITITFSTIVLSYVNFQVVRRANGVQYGLCAAVWTSDASRLHRVARKLEVIKRQYQTKHLFPFGIILFRLAPCGLTAGCFVTFICPLEDANRQESGGKGRWIP
jgi:hypothetical protein